MRTSRFTESQILAVLKDGEVGMPVAEIISKHGISRNTYFAWKSKYAGATVSELRRLRELEGRERQAQADVRRAGARERGDQRRLEPKVVTPSAKRQAIALLVSEHRLSVVRACQVARLARAAWYRPPQDRLTRDGPVIEALNAQVEQNPRWGFWKLFDRLHNLGQPWNPKRVHRVYCALRLNRARRTKRRIPRRPKVPLLAPPSLNQTWALDFMRDTLYDGRVFRTLNVLDQGNRECLAIEVGFSLPSRRVIALLDELIALHGAPATLRMDNGPEFLALRLSDWAEQRGLILDFIQPGKPAQNAFIERFNQTYRTRGARRERLPLVGGGPRDHARLAATLQHGTAP